MKIFNAYILFFLGVIALQKCQAATIRRVVIYTSGGMDDAYAFVILLNADRQSLIKIEAIVCIIGDCDIENSCKNTIRLLETAGRLDIPIYKGSKTNPNATYVMPSWYGNDGFGDLSYPINVTTSVLQNALPTAGIYKLLGKYRNEITLICFGALSEASEITEFAALNKLYFKEIFIFGGNYDVLNKGSSYTPHIEYYFGIDPEADQTLFKKANCNITIVPDDVSDSSKIPYSWRWDVLGKVNNPLCNLMNQAEWALFYYISRDDEWLPYDGLITMPLLYPEFTTFKKHNISIELVKPDERGQVIINSNKGNVKIVTGYDETKFKNVIVDACSNVCAKLTTDKYVCSNKYDLGPIDTNPVVIPPVVITPVVIPPVVIPPVIIPPVVFNVFESISNAFLNMLIGLNFY